MTRRLKIAQLAPYYAPVIGGVEVVCQYISEELTNRGHEVHVFTADRNHKGAPRLKMPRDEVINGVNVHRFRSYISVGHYGLFPGFIAPLRGHGFDIIHAHGYRQPQSEIGCRIGARLNIPAILHVHGGFHARSRLKRLMYSLYDGAARRGWTNTFDHFIALTEADRNHLVGIGAHPECISVIRNAAENEAFESSDPIKFRDKHGLQGKKVILFLGILQYYKRPDLLIRALPDIVRKEPSAFVLLVGPDAGELATVQDVGERLGVGAHYKWIGPLRGREKHEALTCAEFLALPSDEDPFGLVLLEAMAHGKPVLTTTAVGAAPIIAANAAGVIVAPGDLPEIVNGATRLLTDAPYAQDIGRNARRLAERVFSVKAVVDEIETLYVRLCEEKPSRHWGA
jgi:glycosyltransferase involved in cell wall biosynthesis